MATSSKLKRRTVATVVLGCLAVPASANGVLDFYYGSLKVGELTSSNSTDFSFAFLATLDGAPAFINDILLDIGNGAFTNTTSAAVTTPSYSYSAGGFEGTGLRSKVSFPLANNVPSARFTVGETATWSIAGTFGDSARAHVNALVYNATTGDYDSVKLTSVVPEPEAYAMALSALGVLAVFRRRRQRPS